MNNTINKYFDKIYVLNLHKRKERLHMTKKRMEFCDIEFEVFGATDGSVMKKIWESYYKENKYFSNSSYIGCAVSHLSIYRDALENGYEKILILEDDNRIHREANKMFNDNFLKAFQLYQTSTLFFNWELMYLGFIPLTDDCSMWSYNELKEFIAPRVFKANNLWGLFAYGIKAELMKELLEVYDKSFPMELDRYFVKHIQPRGKSIGLTPQLFAAEDGMSDNSGIVETSMLDRSIDSRFANKIDYI
jgi:GR25 family glycosyltransferase involved in LPS biosynthesis